VNKTAKNAPPLLADPWNDLFGGCLYDHLDVVGIGPSTSLTELRQRYVELLALGAASKSAEDAYDTLQVIPSRLCHDILMYDAQVADELLELLHDLPDLRDPEPPLNEQLVFAWDA